MTVASLWKALDRAGCGKRIGIKELQDHHDIQKKTNPWNFREMHKVSQCPENQPVLAVDLSIWICEALTSCAMKDNHVADPPVQLVYSRALKLLTLGIKLVVVIEGKRRNRSRKSTDNIDKSRGNHSNDEKDNVNARRGEDKFRKRRSGTMFWNACQRCETMLKLLGVIVVRAKAEGEALCALLNQKGIVDGVISNDGDCFLFGAKVLYTKFSVENLDRSKVIRYDANEIRAVVDDDDADKYDETGRKSKHGQDVVELSRNDLIAFAILTGSDLAGEGLSKVGCRKAIRFIRKCQIDNPLKLDGDSSPALDLLVSWENTAASSSNCCNVEENNNSGPRCSCCGHLGTKKDHLKHGCKGCGTEPGEPCFPLSPGGRFRKLLRSKALSVQSSFDPSLVLKTYHEPNENQIPLCLVGKTARTIQMNAPQLGEFLELPFIIRGRSLQESREFTRKSLSAYLARQELFKVMSKLTKEDQLTKLPKNHNHPAPLCISKLMIRNGKPSCEVQWVVKATASDGEGNPLDQYEFSTIEDEIVIKRCYPKLFHKFQEEQKKLQQQGSAEQEKRRNFLLCMEKLNDQGVKVPSKGAKRNPTRKDYFDHAESIDEPAAHLNGISDDVKAILIQVSERKESKKDQTEDGKTDSHIGRVISTKADNFRERCPKRRFGPIGDNNIFFEEKNDDSSTIGTVDRLGGNVSDKNTSVPNPQEEYFGNALPPGHVYYLGIESAFQFRSMAEGNFHLGVKNMRSNSVKEKSELSFESKRVNQESKHDLESLSRNMSHLVGNSCSEAFRCEYKGLEQRQDGCYANKSKTKAVIEGPAPVEEQLKRATVTARRCPSRSPLRKRRKDQLFERKAFKINNCFYHERAASAENNPRSGFQISNHESVKQNRNVRDHAINVDRNSLCRGDHTKLGKNEIEFCPFNNFYDQHEERIGAFHHQNLDRQSSEYSIGFNSNECQSGWYGLKDNWGHKDHVQSSFHDFKYETYDRNTHAGMRIQRERSIHQKAGICSLHLDNHCVPSESDAKNDYDISCYSLHHDHSEIFCSGSNNAFNYKDMKISRNKILPDQSWNEEHKQRCFKWNKEVHNIGIPNQHADGLNCHETCCCCCKRDALCQEDNLVADTTPFEMPCPQNLSFKFGDQGHSQNRFYPHIFDDRDECEDNSFHAEAWKQEIDQDLIARRETGQDQHFCKSAYCCLVKRDSRGYGDQSKSTAIVVSPNFDMHSIEREELEKRVAARIESKFRRAQVGMLCSKFVSEE